MYIAMVSSYVHHSCGSGSAKMVGHVGFAISLPSIFSPADDDASLTTSRLLPRTSTRPRPYPPCLAYHPIPLILLHALHRPPRLSKAALQLGASSPLASDDKENYRVCINRAWADTHSSSLHTNVRFRLRSWDQGSG